MTVGTNMTSTHIVERDIQLDGVHGQVGGHDGEVPLRAVHGHGHGHVGDLAARELQPLRDARAVDVRRLYVAAARV